MVFAGDLDMACDHLSTMWRVSFTYFHMYTFRNTHECHQTIFKNYRNAKPQFSFCKIAKFFVFLTCRFVERLGYELESEYSQWLFEELDGTNQVGGYAAYYYDDLLSYVTVKVCEYLSQKRRISASFSKLFEEWNKDMLQCYPQTICHTNSEMSKFVLWNLF